MRFLIIIGVALTSFVKESYEATTPAGKISSPSPAVPPPAKFHCEFDNPYFQVTRDEQDPYVWGDPVEPYNATNWDDLLNKILFMDQIKDAFYHTEYFDRFNSYMRNYHAIKDFLRSKKVTFDLELLKDVKLIREFNSLYHLDNDPRRLFNDNALALKVAFLRGILRGDPEVGRHLFFAIGGGTAADVEKYRNETNEYPDQLLVNENFHPILKFSVDGDVGYLVPAVETPGGKGIIVMEKDPTPEAFEPNDEYGPESDPPVKYHLTGKNKAFIEIVRFRYDQDRNLFVPNLDWSSVIYVGRPLCSFLEAHIRRTLLYTPTLSYVAYRILTHEGEDHIYAAGFLYAHLKPEDDRPMFDLGYRSDDSSGEEDELELDPIEIHFHSWSELLSVKGHHTQTVMEHIEMTLRHFELNLDFLRGKILHFEEFLEEISMSMEDYIEQFKIAIQRLEDMCVQQEARIEDLEARVMASSAVHPGDQLPASHYKRMGTYHGSSPQDRQGRPAIESEDTGDESGNGIESDDDDFAPPTREPSDNRVTKDPEIGDKQMTPPLNEEVAPKKENPPLSTQLERLSTVDSQTNNYQDCPEELSKSKRAKSVSCMPFLSFPALPKRTSKNKKRN